jgi:hypothetical protein
MPPSVSISISLLHIFVINFLSTLTTHSLSNHYFWILTITAYLPCQVEVRDFVEVMCLSQGITADSLGAHLNGPAVDETGAVKVKEAVATPGIVPPRREIGEWLSSSGELC